MTNDQAKLVKALDYLQSMLDRRLGQINDRVCGDSDVFKFAFESAFWGFRILTGIQLVESSRRILSAPLNAASAGVLLAEACNFQALVDGQHSTAAPDLVRAAASWFTVVSHVTAPFLQQSQEHESAVTPVMPTSVVGEA